MEKLQSRKEKKCRAYISKDAQIKALKERNKELEEFELDNIELKNANKLAHERIKELERSIEQLEIELQ